MQRLKRAAKDDSDNKRETKHAKTLDQLAVIRQVGSKEWELRKLQHEQEREDRRAERETDRSERMELARLDHDRMLMLFTPLIEKLSK